MHTLPTPKKPLTVHQLRQYIGQRVDVVVDRPRFSLHPTHGYTYEVNYGYLPGTLSGDGEELDAYVLGVDEPIDHFSGVCIAILHRIDDDDDKLIVTPAGNDLTDDEIRSLTQFKEQFFQSVIWR